MTSVRDLDRLLADSAWLRSLTRKLVGDDHASDLQQDVVLAALTQPAAAAAGRSWLAAVAHNLAVTLLRRRSAEQDRLRFLAPKEPVPSPAELVATAELQQRLGAAVLTLPAVYRDTVLLRFQQELPLAATAQAMGVPEETVRTRQRRALALLRERLDAEHGGDRRAWLLPLVPFAAGRPSAVSVLGASTAGVLLMTIQMKVLSAVGVLLLAGLVLWAVSDSWSAVPTVGAGSSPPASALSADFPSNSVPVQPTDVVQRTAIAPPVTVPDATALLVHAVYGDDRSPVPDLLLIVGRADEDTRVGPRRLRTDAQGNARFDGLQAGRVVIRNANGPRAIDAEVRRGEVTTIEYELRPGIDITGIVVDRTGLPVPGAEVHLGTPAWSGADAEQATTADAAGRFALRCCTNPSVVGARAPGHAASILQLIYGEKGAKFDVRIELPAPGGEVEGVVVGPDRSPVADATVRIGTGSLHALQATRSGAPPFPAQVRTDREGHYRAAGLGAGEHPVVVRAAGLAPWTGTCQVAANLVTALPVVLGAGVTVAGTVHSDEGVAVPQANVTVGREGDLTYYRTRSGADGTFHLQGLPAAEFELAVMHEKFGKAAMKLCGTAGKVMTCDVRLTLGLVLRGRLMTEGGEPVAGAFVAASAEAGNGEARWEVGARVDAEGRFAIDNCPDGRLLGIKAEGRGIVALRQHRVDPRAGELLLLAKKSLPVPAASARIVGTVVHADGKPAVGIHVTADDGRDGSRATTDGSGRFEFGPRVPGMVRVRVDLDKMPLFSSHRELAADATWDLGTVRLVGGTILVRFDGMAEGVRLRLYDPQGEWVTNIDAGAFPFRSRLVVPGRYRLFVSGPEIAAMTLPAEVRENEETVIDVRPKRGVARKIEFTNAGGWQNVKWLDVAITSGADLVLKTTVGIGDLASPTLTCRLVPGSYTVTAKAEGVSGRAEFTVAEGGDAAAVRVSVH